MLNIMFTIIPDGGTEPDLKVFPFVGDDVFSLAKKGSTHGYSPSFSVFNLKNKVMDASGNRIISRAKDRTGKKTCLPEHR